MSCLKSHILPGRLIVPGKSLFSWGMYKLQAPKTKSQINLNDQIQNPKLVVREKPPTRHAGPDPASRRFQKLLDSGY